MGSSSSGNSTQIYTETSSIVIDAGIGLRKFQKMYVDESPTCVDLSIPDAFFITHGHSDHIKGLDVICAQYAGSRRPRIHIHEKVYEAKKEKFPRVSPAQVFLMQHPGTKYPAGHDLMVKSFSTKHDSEYSLGFTIKQYPNGPKIGYLTDTGVVTPVIKQALQDCDAYFIEADYDEEEIEKYADYSIELKERIKSSVGHLSSNQAIDFVKQSIDLSTTKKIVFGHLSEKTNSPDLVMSKIEKEFPNHIDKFIIAKAHEPTKVVIE